MNEILCYLVTAYTVVVFVRIVLSWIPISPTSGAAQLVRLVYDLTEPVMGPLRRVIPPAGMIDLSPTVLIIGLFVLRGVVCRG
ncbi:MAG: YggT family protein [Acidimicrobiia bacterium]